MTLTELKALREKATKGPLTSRGVMLLHERGFSVAFSGIGGYDADEPGHFDQGTADMAYIAALVNWFDTEAQAVFEDAERQVVGWIQEHKDDRKSFYEGNIDPREVHDNGCPTYPVYRLARKEQGHG